MNFGYLSLFISKAVRNRTLPKIGLLIGKLLLGIEFPLSRLDLLLIPDFLIYLVFVFSWFWHLGFIFSYILSFFCSKLSLPVCALSMSSLFYLLSVLRNSLKSLDCQWLHPCSFNHYRLLLLKIIYYQFKGILGGEDIKNMLL